MPSHKKNMSIKLYSKPLCGWCQEAKNYLRQRRLPFVEINVAQNPSAYEEMKRLSGQPYVPTIVINDRVLADFDVEQLETFLASLNVNAPPTKP